MNLLHNIQRAVSGILIWAYAYGGNGRVVGAGNGNVNRQARHEIRWHIWRIERGVPNIPINTADWPSRRYWEPYRVWGVLTTEQILTPLCGRLKSQSRGPTLEPANRTPVSRCPECEYLGNNATVILAQARANDPWSAINWSDRDTTLDPVSGM